jgi:hypothetical protein
VLFRSLGCSNRQKGPGASRGLFISKIRSVRRPDNCGLDPCALGGRQTFPDQIEPLVPLLSPEGPFFLAPKRRWANESSCARPSWLSQAY